jgi:hypothetical protein
MRRRWIALSLAGTQVVLAVVLLTVGRRQVPQIAQDSPIFVGPAARIGVAINAPAALLEGALASLVHSAGVTLRFDEKLWGLCYFAGVAILWFLVGLEIEHRSQKRDTRLRVFVGSLAIGVGIILVFFAFTAWRQGDAILSSGAAAWALVLIGFYGLELARFAGSRRAARLST